LFVFTSFLFYHYFVQRLKEESALPTYDDGTLFSLKTKAMEIKCIKCGISISTQPLFRIEKISKIFGELNVYCSECILFDENPKPIPTES
jgi:hypothetical protein